MELARCGTVRCAALWRARGRLSVSDTAAVSKKAMSVTIPTWKCQACDNRGLEHTQQQLLVTKLPYEEASGTDERCYHFTFSLCKEFVSTRTFKVVRITSFRFMLASGVISPIFGIAKMRIKSDADLVFIDIPRLMEVVCGLKKETHPFERTISLLTFSAWLSIPTESEYISRASIASAASVI